MIHPIRTLRLRTRPHSPFGTLVRLSLLLGLVLFAAACSGDDGETTDAGDTTGVTDPAADDADQTVQTLDDAAPAEAREPVEDETALVEPGLALNPQGLDILDPDATTTELLAFGDDQGAVLAGLEAVLGSADQVGEGTGECPNGQATVATWDDSLTVDFDADGLFLSWLAPPGSQLTTIDGIGIGSPVSALGDDAIFVEDSTLGNEFTGGGYSGLAGGTGADATIDRLWAGEVCAFR